MRKFRLIAVVVAMVASAFAFTTASPASAYTGACAAVGGTITLDAGLGLPGITTTTANISGNLGCVAPLAIDASFDIVAPSSLTGACGRSAGTVTAEGHSWLLQTAGTKLILVSLGGTGVAVGNAVANPLHGAHGTHTTNSCVDGTAHSFLINGVVAHAS